MADNVAITAGSGTTIAADEVTDGTLGSVKVQYVKIMDGTLDGTTKAVVGAAGIKVDGSGAAIPVTDNSGSLTVDNAGTFAVQATLAAGAASIGKAEDVASADADVGVPAMMVRKATPANTSGTDGDYEFIQGSAGRVWTSTVIDTALPAGSAAIGKLAANSGVTIGAVELAAAQTLATVTTITNAVGTNADAALTAGTAPSKAHVSGGQYNSTEPSPTTGQTVATQLDSKGRARQVIMDAAGNTRGANVNASSQLSVSVDNTVTVASHAVTNAGTFAVQAAGDVASGSSDSGNPQKIGAVGHTAAPTAVTDGQRVNLIADKVGKLITVGAIRDLKGTQQTQISASTSETTIVTAVASTFLDLYGLVLANTGATTTKVSIRDDTAGTVRMIIEVPTLETRGFMLPVDSAVPQTAVNKNWTAQCGSSTTALEVTALFVKNI